MNKKTLIIVDPQYDFMEGGSLPVKGGTRALDNLVEHLISESDNYSSILVTLDTHHPTNLAFKENWVGNVSEIREYEQFPVDVIKEGTIRPRFSYTAKRDLSKLFCQQDFRCWPKHCIKGTSGWEIHEVLKKLLDSLGNRVTYLLKGEDDSRDCYSAFHYGDGGTTENKIYLDYFTDTDYYFAGLAKDFCVYDTIRSVQSLVVSRNSTFTLLDTCTASIGTSEEVEKKYQRLIRPLNIG